MNRGDARVLALAILEEWEQKKPEELLPLLERKYKYQVPSGDKHLFNVVIDVFWEDETTVHISVAVDDGGLSALSPVAVGTSLSLALSQGEPDKNWLPYRPPKLVIGLFLISPISIVVLTEITAEWVRWPLLACATTLGTLYIEPLFRKNRR